MSRRDGASKLDSSSEKRSVHCRRHCISVRHVAFGTAGRELATGSLTKMVLSLVDTILRNHPLMAGDAIPMGSSEIRRAPVETISVQRRVLLTRSAGG
jgi:hypothetical protein